MAGPVTGAAAQARPLRPLVLVWAAVGILPWVIAALLWPSAPWAKAASAFHVAALFAVIFAVKDRVPVASGKVATGASLVLFGLAVVRFGLMPFGEGLFIDGTNLDAVQADIARMLLYAAILGVAFHVTTVVLLVSVLPSLVRHYLKR